MVEPRSLMSDQPQESGFRSDALAILVEGTMVELSSGLGEIGELPPFEEVRRPESGLVMVRGRAGGDGQPFNLGEATVSRAAIRLASGETGFGYVLGRDLERSRLIAICDALLQHDDYREPIEQHVLRPIRARRIDETNLLAQRTAATRVDFFTLVRGEDA